MILKALSFANIWFCIASLLCHSSY